MQFWLQVSNTGILNTCTQLWLMESEQATPVDSIKDVVQSSMKVPEFDKQLIKARGHIGRNFVAITIKMNTIVRKPLMIKMYLSVNSFVEFLLQINFPKFWGKFISQHYELLWIQVNPFRNKLSRKFYQQKNQKKAKDEWNYSQLDLFLKA